MEAISDEFWVVGFERFFFQFSPDHLVDDLKASLNHSFRLGGSRNS